MKNYFKLMRVHHWIKNGLVFTALACSGQLFNEDKLALAIIGFFSFCLLSSAVYIINDIFDREKDRKHPVKCNRPIASGAVPVSKAWLLCLSLLLIAFLLDYLVRSKFSVALLILYLVLNIGYSFGLKNIPILDIAILVSGFLIRILYGAVITEIVISNWLYLTVISLSFYLALGKRRNELDRIGGSQTRKVLERYPASFLTNSMQMCLTLTVVFYSLWTMDENTVIAYNTSSLIFTVPVVLLIVLKYSIDVEGNSDGDPVDVLLHDRILLSMVIMYLFLMFWILYL